ncbi:hypothetical protein [Mesorhizobium sp. WSM3873]|uniref:hypothetical protein n=1 Tax=Mesorhizobium sp. WSM3873 TaxID=1854056 RepID=UPI00122B8586|nr:hypothetical protein [Mesorhizobium sp. WSM3873]TIW60097.1 MAG: hypothetical protein E5V48_15180 [Mesorhizobium sp.]TJW91356.1 MAG: hypothetical protein E5V92_00180 [Mesorhizobium sp.]
MGTQEKALSLSEIENENLKWISEHYLRGVYTLLNSNRVYLNQGITWSIGIITAAVLFSVTYLSPLQVHPTDAGGTSQRLGIAGILQNVSDADVLLLMAVLAVSFAFVSNFMSRSIKGYVNLMRYAGLYSACIRMASGTGDRTPAGLKQLVADINKYDVNFAPSLTLRRALAKMLTELGYGLFFAIIGVLQFAATLVWLRLPPSPFAPLFWVALAMGPVWFVVELIFLRWLSSYFRYRGDGARGWPEAERLK